MEDKFLEYISKNERISIASQAVNLEEKYKEVTVFVPKNLVKKIEEKAEKYGYKRYNRNNDGHEYPASITFRKQT